MRGHTYMWIAQLCNSSLKSTDNIVLWVPDHAETSVERRKVVASAPHNNDIAQRSLIDGRWRTSDYLSSHRVHVELVYFPPANRHVQGTIVTDGRDHSNPRLLYNQAQRYIWQQAGKFSLSRGGLDAHVQRSRHSLHWTIIILSKTMRFCPLLAHEPKWGEYIDFAHGTWRLWFALQCFDTITQKRRGGMGEAEEDDHKKE